MKKILFVVLLITVSILIACGGGSSATTVASDSIPAEYAGKTNPLGVDAATSGAEIFKNNCAACHGSEGHGDGPASAALDPAPRNLAEMQAQVGDDYLFWRINTGKEGTAMVAWKGTLTDDQIWQVISFLHTLR